MKKLICAVAGCAFSIIAVAAAPARVVAHRGCHITPDATENSIRALVKADSIGVDAVEFDVWMSADSVLYVHHNAETADGTVIENATSDVLDKIRLANGEPLPRLDKYLETAKDLRPDLVFELKSHSTPERDNLAADLSVSMIADKALKGRTTYITFSDTALHRLIAGAGAPVYALSAQEPAALAAKQATGPDFHIDEFRTRHPSWIAEAHAKGMPVNIWTVNSPDDIQWCIDNGADFITTDEPERAMRMVNASAGIYRNPVLRREAADPTVLRASDGNFYLVSTESVPGMPIFKSPDGVNWELVGTVFSEENHPQFPADDPDLDRSRPGRLWAPELREINGKFIVLYSLAQWGNEWVSAIGYAVADSLEGPYTDRGFLFNSRKVNVRNSIDQFLFTDNGHHYLSWGSFYGIYMMEVKIDRDGNIRPLWKTQKQIAGDAYEGNNLFRRGDYYYLIGSIGTCCEGLNSTYKAVVGRSKNIWGPYVDREGRPMLESTNIWRKHTDAEGRPVHHDNHELIVRGNLRFFGTGHNSQLVTDDAGNDWIYYHAYEDGHPERQRQVLLDRIVWDSEGWPVVAGELPSDCAAAPVILKK